MKFRNTISVLSCAATAALFLGATLGCGDKTTSNGTDGGNGGGNGDTPVAVNRPAPLGSGNSVADGDDVIKIGLIASQNGNLRPWGVDSVDGAMLAVKQINDAGGIDGKQIKLVVGDSNSKPEEGKNAAEKLVSEGVIGLIGEVSSGITAQLADVAKERGVPLVAVGATKPDITTKGSNIFRVCYTDDLQGPVMAVFAYRDLGLTEVAIVTDVKQPYSTGLSETFRTKFEELGGKIVDVQNYETGSTAFNGQIANLKAKNPQGLFLSGYFNEVGPFVYQARDQGIGKEVYVFGGDGWDSAEILNSGGDAILGGYFCNHYNENDDRPEVASFLEAWKAEHGGVPGTTMGALGYDATALMIDAIGRAAELNSTSVTEALEATVDFKGVSGDITLLDQNGNPPKRAIVVELTNEGQSFTKAYEASEVIGE